MPALPDEAFTYGYIHENQEFVRSFSNNKVPRENLTHAVEVMEFLMAVYRSSETGKSVRLPDPSLIDYKPLPYKVAEEVYSKR